MSLSPTSRAPTSDGARGVSSQPRASVTQRTSGPAASQRSTVLVGVHAGSSPSETAISPAPASTSTSRAASCSVSTEVAGHAAQVAHAEPAGAQDRGRVRRPRGEHGLRAPGHLEDLAGGGGVDVGRVAVARRGHGVGDRDVAERAVAAHREGRLAGELHGLEVDADAARPPRAAGPPAPYRRAPRTGPCARLRPTGPSAASASTTPRSSAGRASTISAGSSAVAIAENSGAGRPRPPG